MDMVDSQIDIPYPTSISHTHIKMPIDTSLTSDLLYQSYISISRIEFGSYLVTLIDNRHSTVVVYPPPPPRVEGTSCRHVRPRFERLF